MMGWERIIMRRTVEALCHDHPSASSLRVLNVGFGLGIVSNIESCPFAFLNLVLIDRHAVPGS
jgi:protein arginine N-methyltransferase 2